MIPASGTGVVSCCTYSQHLCLQQSPVLHAAGGVHVKQLALNGRRITWGQKEKQESWVNVQDSDLPMLTIKSLMAHKDGRN